MKYYDGFTRIEKRWHVYTSFGGKPMRFGTEMEAWISAGAFTFMHDEDETLFAWIVADNPRPDTFVPEYDAYYPEGGNVWINGFAVA